MDQAAKCQEKAKAREKWKGKEKGNGNGNGEQPFYPWTGPASVLTHVYRCLPGAWLTLFSQRFSCGCLSCLARLTSPRLALARPGLAEAAFQDNHLN
ncbi:hypothetical protein AWZ03_003984 [Drosophila navojoa]|uniref:Uncharacterized protein n=1 Tax=Drosophila navojoa TaxID=7232 RepID=A0A484BL44_DRONA|nr:hypothetical protein AWZ03_003984 [Drosophila navojoa]